MHVFSLSMYCFFHRIRKRQAMVFILLFSFLISAGENFKKEAYYLHCKSESDEKVDLNQSIVFRARSSSSEDGYRNTFNSLLLIFEEKNEKEINPTNFPKIAIKLDTTAAPGLQVSQNLINGLLKVLQERKFSKDQVVFVAMMPENLKISGFLEYDRKSFFYKGYRVHTPNDPDFYNSAWFHDSAMPPKIYDRARFFLNFPFERKKRLKEERRSYIPRIFLNDEVYWINLAVAMDDVCLGVNGAAVNMSLGAVSNDKRFRDDPTLGSAAVTEILAIPEIWNGRLFSVVDMSRFQFAGGPFFDAEFLDSAPFLLLGENPFALDFVAGNFITRSRKIRGMKNRVLENALIFQYAEKLGLERVKSPLVLDIR